jgi:hypothetical protein
MIRHCSDERLHNYRGLHDEGMCSRFRGRLLKRVVALHESYATYIYIYIILCHAESQQQNLLVAVRL